MSPSPSESPWWSVLRSSLPAGPALTPTDRAGLARGLTWCIGLVVAGAVAPVIFLALQGVLGLAAAGLVGLVGIHAAPVVAMKLSNLRLGALRREARSNPMVTLEAQLIERRQALHRAAEQLNLALGRIDAFIDQAGQFMQREPARAERWKARVDQASQLRVRKIAALKQAAGAVQAFEQEVERARTEWSLVEAEQAMQQALGAARGDPLQQLLERTALDSVREQMNRAFAGLETELALDTADPQGAARMPATAVLVAPAWPTRSDR